MPRTEDTASWIALTVGATIGALGDETSFVVKALVTAPAASGSPKTDETASTRVSAPSRRRDIARRPICDLAQDIGIGELVYRVRGKAPEEGNPGAKVRGLDLDRQAPLEAIPQALLER